MNKPIRTWKQIAAYLDVHPDTLKRWHKIRPIPVFYDDGGAACIYPDTLREWHEKKCPENNGANAPDLPG